MKKILGFWAFCSVCLGIGATCAASNTDCLDVVFDNGDSICIAMDKRGTTYDVTVASYSLGSNLSRYALACELETPDGVLHFLGGCEGSFTCSSNYCNGNKKVTLNVRYDNSRYRERIVDYYDFTYGDWDSYGNRGGSNSNSHSNSYLSISSSQTSPSINTYVNLTAETDRDYRGWVTFEMQYRASSSNSWQNVSSSSYFVASNAFTNGYQFTSYDDGYRTFGSFVSFMKAGQFRVVAKDDSGRTAYAQFFVEEDSTTNSFLSLSASTTSPSLNTYVDVTVETDSTYRGGVDFSLEYRSSSSSSWKTISSSSSDISASTYLRNGYQFTSSDRGYKKFYDFLKFYEAGEYRLTAEDDTGRERSLTFYVKESRSTVNDYIRITTNRSYPDVDQYVNITLETSSDYRGRVDFEVQYRSTSSSSWSKLGTSSSSYFTADSYLRNGYQFTSSDRGYRSFSNFIRFAKSGSYRLYVKDSAGNQDYVQFDIQSTDSSSSVNGFTNAELRKVTNLSKIWNSVIDQLKNKSYSLRTDSYWQRLSDSLYTNMRDVVSGNYYRVFKDYSDFLSAFNEWYTYTVRNR